jgi:protein-tyrosine phosphatase
MIDTVDSDISKAKNSSLKSYRRQRFTDIHCHCLPGLDDGPETMYQAVKLCQELSEEGIGTVVATPHQLGRFEYSNDAKKIKETIRILNNEIRNNSISLKIVPGGEIRVDERICQLLKDDRILTLADGGKYILLELPYQIFVDIEPLLIELASMGIQSVISHAELIAPLSARPEIVRKWLEGSTYLQITAASLVGDFGSEVQKVALNFLESGLATFVATDSHNINLRKPRMKAAFKLISTRFGEDAANLVCIENPSRIVNGLDILSFSLYEQQKENR